MSITVNIPEVQVTAPSAPPTGAVVADAPEGATGARVYLPSVLNDSNVAQTLRVTISNVVNATVNRLGFVVDGSLSSQNNVLVYEKTLQPGKSAEGDVLFGVTPGQPGQPASQATADYLYEWV